MGGNKYGVIYGQAFLGGIFQGDCFACNDRYPMIQELIEMLRKIQII